MNGSTEISAYKLNVSGVLDMYYVTNGNGSDSFFVFLKENGTLSYLNYYNLLMTGELDVKDISGISNVVSVVQNSYTLAAYAVNLDGTTTSLGQYLKKYYHYCDIIYERGDIL